MELAGERGSRLDTAWGAPWRTKSCYSGLLLEGRPGAYRQALSAAQPLGSPDEALAARRGLLLLGPWPPVGPCSFMKEPWGRILLSSSLVCCCWGACAQFPGRAGVHATHTWRACVRPMQLQAGQPRRPTLQELNIWLLASGVGQGNARRWEWERKKNAGMRSWGDRQ